MSDSTLYTIGTALNRAKDRGVAVQVLVEGMWLRGRVLAVDGFGLCLNSEDQEHSVVRIESISAVTIATSAPPHVAIPAGSYDGAHAMPSPRASHEN